MKEGEGVGGKVGGVVGGGAVGRGGRRRGGREGVGEEEGCEGCGMVVNLIVCTKPVLSVPSYDLP